MPRSTFPLFALGAFVVLAAANAPLAGSTDDQAGRHVLTTRVGFDRAVTRRDSTPLYTEEQATAGAALFTKVCAECHEKKDIAGADFRAKWNGRTLYDLYELVRTTMPDSDPGKFSRDEYAGALAYILKQNGLPSGTTAVMPDSAAMSGVKLDLSGQAPPSDR